MRKVIASPFVTLDGFIAGPDGEVDWSVWDEAFDREQLPALLDRVDAILLGRLTYQALAAYWPVTSAQDDRVADLMNTIPKSVFSRTLSEAPWGHFNNARVVTDDPAEAVARMKQQSGKDLVIFGSGRLVSELAQAGLIDEYQLRVNPVVLGRGKRLFPDLKETVKLKLLDSRTSPSGVVVLHYQLDNT
ncbi:MAG TPA: dihydrofolate reductase family protein [Ktedonobacteraceae bacterium]